jgi:Uma2 family endonuclease
LLYEDEGLEMGESSVHTRTTGILLYGLAFHFGAKKKYRVFGNHNLYYSEQDPAAYISPDVMVVQPSRPLPEEVTSLHMGQECPAPFVAAEVLSFRTYQQGDLTNKPILNAGLGIPEYLLVDVRGDLLPDRLVMLRRRAKGT